MLHLKLILLVATGGALGSAGRYVVNAVALRVLGPAFPWGILIVNVAGSLAMGVVAGLAIHRSAIGSDTRLFLATGVLGGFTTFSAFALDAIVLGEKNLPASAAYVVSSVALSLGALYIGLALTK